MCGLFGVIGSGINQNDLNIFQDLLVFNAVRGWDGTGVMTANTNTKNGNINIHKKAYDSFWYLRTLEKKQSSNLSNISNNVFIGHTRWATVGKTNDEAAQPFEMKSFIGTHNGTIDLDWKDYNSDSEAFFQKIEEIGPKAAVATLGDKDAFAIVSYHKPSRHVYMMRNDKRSLNFAICPDRSVLYYASELGMLKAALERHNVKPAQYWFPKPYILYEFDPKSIRDLTEKEDGKLYKANLVSTEHLIDNKEPTTDV